MSRKPAPTWPPDAPPGTRGTVVVIEDHLILRSTLVGLLESLGYAVQQSANGFSGLRLVQRVQPDLVVLDLLIPDLPGRTVLEEMRAHPATARTPVLIVTGFPGDVTSWGPYERLLSKPFKYEAFVETVEALAAPGPPVAASA